MCLTVMSYDSTSRLTAAAVRTVWLPSVAVAVTYALYEPSTLPPRVESAVTVASAVPPAGTVTWGWSRVKKPVGAALPLGSVAARERSRVTSVVPRLR
jgi:hypothetical protein